MRARSVIPLVACLVAGQALGAQWVYASTAADGSKMYFDVASIAAADAGRKRAWFKYTGRRERVGAAEAVEIKELFLFDCVKKQIGMKQQALYDQTGAQIGGRSYDESAVVMREPAPDTAPEQFLMIVCSVP